MVLSGHIHVPFDITHQVKGRPLRMIGAGTLSTRLRGTVPSYNVLRHSPEQGLTFELRAFA